MSVFIYDKDKVREWAKGINELISGGGDSFRESFYKFMAQMEVMVEPGTWTGSAAAKNFENMESVLSTMITFSNEFGGNFTASIRAVNDEIANLEISNLGTDTDVSHALNSLEYQNIQNNVGNITVLKDKVTYNKDKLIDVTTNLKNIKDNMANLSSKLTSDLAKLNNGSGIWEGALAEGTKETLTKVSQKNLDSIILTLDKCINNVIQATEAARAFDSSTASSFDASATATQVNATPTNTATGTYTNPGEAMEAALRERGVTHEESIAMENNQITSSYVGSATSTYQPGVETFNDTNASLGSATGFGPGAGLTDAMRKEAIANDNARVASEALAKQIFDNNN